MTYGYVYSPEEKNEIKTAIIKAAQDGAINLLVACEAVKASYYTVFCWLKSDEAFKEQWDAAKESARERRLDRTEAKLQQMADDGDLGAIIFTLKTQGKSRDYNDKVQVTHDVNVNIDLDEAARRIAFAMNAAIDSGKVIEGNYQEVIPALPEPKREQMRLAEIVQQAKTRAKKAKAKPKK